MNDNILTQLLQTPEFQSIKDEVSKEVSGGQGFFSKEMEQFSDLIRSEWKTLVEEDIYNITDIAKIHRAYTSSLEAQVMSLCSMLIMEKYNGDPADLLDDADAREKQCSLIKHFCLGAMDMVNRLTVKTASEWGVDMGATE